MSDRPIGFIDSGIGGITTLAAAIKRLPHENYIYLADFSSMPYGEKSREYILARTVDNCYTLLNMGCKAIVVACNTATNVGISFLRDYDTFLSKCLYVGLEPAVLPAVRSGAKKILVLVTPATAAQKKFRLLTQNYVDKLVISPQATLASRIEDRLRSGVGTDDLVAEIMNDHSDADAVVLGCTHYVFLKSGFVRLFGDKYRLFDGNEGAVKRLESLLAERGLFNTSASQGCIKFIRR